MRETPPYSLAEIRLLLAQALDGTLEPERMLALDELMVKFPAYQDEFLKLQATRNLVRESLEEQAEAASSMSGEAESASLWQNIAAQLAADGQEPALNTYSPEWVSAYVDGEIPREDAERAIFEGQLAHNDEARQLLADLTQVSETVKQFGYHQEEAIRVDLTHSVMAAFQAEQAAGFAVFGQNSLDEAQPLDVDWELLSAFTDQELSAREIIQATQLIESSDAARANFAKLNALSEHIQRVGKQLEAQSFDVWPDVWPKVETALNALPDSEKIVPMAKAGRVHWLRKAAIPIAATLLLGLLSWPNMHFTGLTSPVSRAASTAHAAHARSESLKAEEAQPADSQELASVPVSSRNIQSPHELSPAMDSDDLRQAGLRQMVDDVSAQAPSVPVVMSHSALRAKVAPLKPMLEPQSVMADMSSASSQTAMPGAEVSPHSSPSSEAYLFDALNKPGADEEDISTMLGK